MALSLAKGTLSASLPTGELGVKILETGFKVICSTMIFGFASTTMAASPVVPLASHQAVYDLEFVENKSSSGITSARGRIVMEVENNCDGYVLNQRMLLEIGSNGSATVVSDYNMTTWEDKEGNALRFNVLNTVNGRVVEKTDGVATKNEEDVIVNFANEDKDPQNLPKSAIFPTVHTYQILKAARDGKKVVSAKIYTGGAEDGLQDTLTIIGKEGQKTPKIMQEKELSELKSWPLQMSFFDLNSNAGEPDYTVSFKLYENGMNSDLMLHYKEFSLKGKLVKLELYKTPNCS
jgi:EipB-like